MDAPEMGSTGSAIVAAGGVGVPDRTPAARRVPDIERRPGDAMLGFARHLGLDDALAEDAVQEALLRLYDAINTGTRIDDLRAWTFTVVYRLSMDEHRRRERSNRLDPVVGSRSDTDGDPVSAAERQIVWNEVDQLPERQRSVLYLRYRADLPFETIGRVLGITASAARSHATQAVGTLRLRLAGEEAS